MVVRGALLLWLAFAVSACAAKPAVYDDPLKLTRETYLTGWELADKLPPRAQYDEVFEGKDYDVPGVRILCPNPQQDLDRAFCQDPNRTTNPYGESPLRKKIINI